MGIILSSDILVRGKKLSKKISSSIKFNIPTNTAKVIWWKKRRIIDKCFSEKLQKSFQMFGNNSSMWMEKTVRKWSLKINETLNTNIRFRQKKQWAIFGYFFCISSESPSLQKKNCWVNYGNYQYLHQRFLDKTIIYTIKSSMANFDRFFHAYRVKNEKRIPLREVSSQKSFFWKKSSYISSRNRFFGQTEGL